MVEKQYPSDEVVLEQFKDHVKETFTEQAKEYVKSRAAYLKVGKLLEENRVLYQMILQNQEDIKEIITKGWGY